MMAQKTKDKKEIGHKIRAHFSRNQGWLASQIKMSESQLSKKMNGSINWTQEELDKINEVLGENFKL